MLIVRGVMDEDTIQKLLDLLLAKIRAFKTSHTPKTSSTPEVVELKKENALII